MELTKTSTTDNMNELPNEILVGIFKRLANTDLNLCADVCQLWRDLIFDAIGLTRYVGTPPDYFSVKYKTAFFDVKEIGQTGLHSCVISNLGDQDLPNFRSGYLTKNFQIFGSISISNYNKLLIPLENLTGLSFHVTALTTFKFGDGHALLKFPKLKRFILTGDECMLQQFMGSLPTHDVFRSNLVTFFLDTHFLKLETLNICEVPLVSTDHDMDLVESMVFFMVRHRATLRTLEFTNCTQLINPGTIPEIPLIESKDIEAIQLNTCDILINHNESQAVKEAFNLIIAAQSSLKYFLVLSGQFCPKFIRQNSATLVRLELNVKFEQDHVIDFQVFENCSSLKALTMIGSLDGTTVITNTKFLGNSMDSVRLIGFNLSTADASALATKNWKMLHYLELQYIGVETAFGVPFNGICALLNLKKIIHVFISNGINKNSITAAKTSAIKVTVPKLAEDILGCFDTTTNTTFELNISLGYDKEYIYLDRRMGRKFYIPQGHDQVYFSEIEVFPEADQISFRVGMLI